MKVMKTKSLPSPFISINHHRSMTPVVVALGSNVGESLSFLQQAVDHLALHLKNLKASHVYQTAPMYVTDQPPFLNAAVSGETSLGPLGLLALLKGVEKEIGRQSRDRFGPREIDLDLVAYGVLKYRYGTRLEIPHPRTPERRFVLQPVFDVAPGLRLSTMGTVESLLAQTEDQASDVVLNKDAVLSVHRDE